MSTRSPGCTRPVSHTALKAVPTGQPTMAPAGKSTFWLVVDESIDLCLIDPGHPVDLWVRADLRCLTQVWMGDRNMRDVIVTGAIELDPDARVQQAIRFVLQKFDELGSTRQVLLWLRREHVSVPVTRGGKHGRFTEWAPPNYTRVHAIVTNPFLAGAYVYGKSESRTTIVDGELLVDAFTPLRVDPREIAIAARAAARDLARRAGVV